jgi:hypothetical protein
MPVPSTTPVRVQVTTQDLHFCIKIFQDLQNVLRVYFANVLRVYFAKPSRFCRFSRLKSGPF